MSRSAEKNKVKKTSKKTARKQVEQKLIKAFADLQKEMGKKKFETSIKKASKLFIVKPAKKAKKETKVKVVKAVSKKEEPAADNA
jgi:predicted RecB family nuclease